MAASELEYYVYEKSPRELRAAVSGEPCVERSLSAACRATPRAPCGLPATWSRTTTSCRRVAAPPSAVLDLLPRVRADRARGEVDGPLPAPPPPERRAGELGVRAPARTRTRRCRWRAARERQALARYHVSRAHTGHEHRAAQHELNVWHADALTMADRHIVYKQCLKEVGQQVRIKRGAASTESMARLRRSRTHALACSWASR